MLVVFDDGDDDDGVVLWLFLWDSLGEWRGMAVGIGNFVCVSGRYFRRERERERE